MTVTLAYIDRQNNCSYIGSDSCASDSMGYSIVRNNKVFHPVGRRDILIGGAGTFRILNLLEHTEGIFPKESELGTNKIDNAYLVNEFIPVLQLLTKDFPEDEVWDLLIAVGIHLYRVQMDFSVIESADDADGIGIGGPVALGALRVLNELKPDILVEDRMKHALNIACTSCIGCMPPFNIQKTELVPDVPESKADHKDCKKFKAKESTCKKSDKKKHSNSKDNACSSIKSKVDFHHAIEDMDVEHAGDWYFPKNYTANWCSNHKTHYGNIWINLITTNNEIRIEVATNHYSEKGKLVDNWIKKHNIKGLEKTLSEGTNWCRWQSIKKYNGKLNTIDNVKWALSEFYKYKSLFNGINN